MDPNATLALMLSPYVDNDTRSDAAWNLADWLQCGGFVPELLEVYALDELLLPPTRALAARALRRATRACASGSVSRPVHDDLKRALVRALMDFARAARLDAHRPHAVRSLHG